jgi:hypothetical protein
LLLQSALLAVQGTLGVCVELLKRAVEVVFQFQPEGTAGLED